jgi:hypothetical protein
VLPFQPKKIVDNYGVFEVKGELGEIHRDTLENGCCITH